MTMIPAGEAEALTIGSGAGFAKLEPGTHDRVERAFRSAIEATAARGCNAFSIAYDCADLAHHVQIVVEELATIGHRIESMVTPDGTGEVLVAWPILGQARYVGRFRFPDRTPEPTPVSWETTADVRRILVAWRAECESRR